MPVLHMGVVDQPYAHDPPKKSRGGRNSTATTGDVATILEEKYHVMEVFYNSHKEDIHGALEESLTGSIESLLMGGPTGGTPFASATSKIEDAFRTFLDSEEMARLGVAGVPTAAALAGVNHRMKISKGSPRPSFIDTGLYESSFKSWVD